ncbi:hypothetical protein ABW19_dt0205448 [Dactylella cylindrospora]|nr:hypothetical protein ABW19_dt0205448 [Dactylella cylindrospora]
MSLFSRVSNTPSAINTTAANTFGQTPSATTGGLGGTGGSLFSQTSSSQAPASAGIFGQTTAAPSGGLFGSTTTTSAPAAGGLFGATTTSTPAAGGLFGGAAPATTPAPAAGGLFGATPSTASAGGGLFAGTGAAATTSAPVGGGLFGAAPAAAPATGGLFGAAQPAQPAPSGGLFGSSAAPATGTAGGLFGGQAQKPAGGLLYVSNPKRIVKYSTNLGIISGQPAAAPASGGLFGSSTAQQPQASLFGQPQQQQQAQAVEMNFSNMRGTTRYEELHQDVRSILDFLDDYIQKAIGISQELTARSVGHKEAMESVDADVELVSRKLGYTSAFLNSDGHAVGQLHNASNQLINTAALSTRTIDILRLPISQRSHYLSSHHTSNPEYSLLPYFEEKTAEIESKAQNFLASVGEVERTVEAIERDVGAVNTTAENKAKDVAKAEKVVFQGMVSVAGKVADINEDLQKLTR